MGEGFYVAGGFEVTAFGGVATLSRAFGVSEGIFISALAVRGSGSGGASRLGCMIRVGGGQFAASSPDAFVLGESFVLSGWHESDVLYSSKNSGELAGNTAADVPGSVSPNRELIIFGGNATAPMRFYGGVWLDNSIGDTSKIDVENYIAEKSGVTLP